MPSEQLKAVAVDLPLSLIQALRLALALMESDFEIRVSPEEAEKFSYLREYFEFSFGVITGREPVLDCVSISHVEPITRIGDIERPLIFPHRVVDRLRTKWGSDRRLTFSFNGVITPSRKEVLESWVREALNRKPPRIHESVTSRKKRLLRPLRSRSVHDRDAGLHIVESLRGRHYPLKAWDEDYFNMLAESEFVLCPKGDCVWTYRFFESTLCGAIPIVEEPSPAYEGFEYFLMKDDARGLRRNPEIAERNFALAVQRLAVPKTDLNRAIAICLDPSR